MSVTEEQSASPYAPPKAQVDTGGVSTSRRPWIAVLLAMLSPTYAMLYVARGWRALGYLAAGLGMFAVATTLTTLLGTSMAMEVLGSGGLHLVGAIDGYGRAKAWQASSPLPGYARWSGLVSIIVVTILGTKSKPLLRQALHSAHRGRNLARISAANLAADTPGAGHRAG